MDAFLDPNPAVGNGDRQSAVTNDWEVTEKLTTAFVKVGIDTADRRLAVARQHRRAERHGRPVFGHQLFLGPRTPMRGMEQSVSIVTSGDKYTDVLPSLNLALELPNDMKLRFGAAITVARPRMDDLAGGAGYTVVPDSATPENVNGQLLYWQAHGRRQSGAEAVEGEHLRSVAREVLWRAGVHLGGRLLQEPDDLHLQQLGPHELRRRAAARPGLARRSRHRLQEADANRDWASRPPR